MKRPLAQRKWSTALEPCILLALGMETKFLWNPRQNNLCQPCENTHIRPCRAFVHEVFFRREKLFCLVLFCLGFGGFCIFPSKMGYGAAFGTFYHWFLRLCHQNWPHPQSLCPPSWEMPGQCWHLAVLTGICLPLGHHDHLGTLVMLVWAVRPPRRASCA